MDYSTYFLSKKEMMVCIGKGILAGMLAAWILYQSVYGMVTVFIFIPLCIQREKKKRREQQKETGWDICRRTASDQSGGWNEPAN